MSIGAAYFKRAAAVLAAVAAAGAAGIAAWRFRAAAKPAEAVPVYTVRRGPLTISVSEAGTVGALDQVEIKSEVEGQTTIIYLIEEGKLAEKGDLLVELDAAALKDSLVEQQIRVNNAEAAFIRARENLAVVRNQAEADVARAELDLKFAREDLDKYEKGEYPKQILELEAKITLAHEDLEQTTQTFEWSQKLFKEQYISQSELQRDELAKKRAELDYNLAKANLELFRQFTHQRKLDELRSALTQAEMALERVRLRTAADIVQAEADLKAKESEFERHKDKAAKIEEQISKTRITAPKAGMVVYATTGQPQWQRTEPLKEGSQVRERQVLIYLPSPGSMMAEVKVHESALQKIAVGFPARVTVDALPGRVFSGKVSYIAPLPDASTRWMNPDLKIYNTRIVIDGNAEELRTGMSCRAEIIVAQYEDALAVPLQAVIRTNGFPVAYVRKGESFEPRRIEIGLDNNRMIHVLSGLSENESVSLVPPLEHGATPWGRPVEDVALMQESQREEQPRNADAALPAERNEAAGERRRPRLGSGGAESGGDAASGRPAAAGGAERRGGNRPQRERPQD